MTDSYEKILSDESYRIIGACMEVHRELGCGFLEAIYQEALEKEFIRRKIPYQKEVKISLVYKGEALEKYYYADFICYDEIILELKAIACFESVHISQVVNYLNVTDLYVGLLVNFGQTSLQQKRIFNSLKNSNSL